MKAKKKWKKLRKTIKTCRNNITCEGCEIKEFCNNMVNYCNLSINSLVKVDNFLKRIKKI